MTKGYLQLEVTIVSPPLFAFDKNDGSDYLADLYRYGREWGWQSHKSPFDAIGYHLYVAQHTGQRNDIKRNIDSALNAILRVARIHGDETKPIYISEVGAVCQRLLIMIS